MVLMDIGERPPSSLYPQICHYDFHLFFSLHGHFNDVIVLESYQKFHDEKFLNITMTMRHANTHLLILLRKPFITIVIIFN